MVEIIRRKDIENVGKKDVIIDVEATPSKRELLFKELDDNGIEYKKNAKTEDLEKLLEDN